ncbi:hypothetical protein C3R44_21345, partial [Mycobacterium tuberculosis]
AALLAVAPAPLLSLLSPPVPFGAPRLVFPGGPRFRPCRLGPVGRFSPALAFRAPAAAVVLAVCALLAGAR